MVISLNANEAVYFTVDRKTSPKFSISLCRYLFLFVGYAKIVRSLYRINGYNSLTNSVILTLHVHKSSFSATRYNSNDLTINN